MLSADKDDGRANLRNCTNDEAFVVWLRMPFEGAREIRERGGLRFALTLA
jgi:hypothetical protein